jgi:hypothetical protein
MNYHSTASRLTVLLIASAALAAACTGAQAPTGTPAAASPTVAATEAPTPTQQPTEAAATAPAAGTATVQTTGDVTADVSVPQEDSTEFPSEDGSFDLHWQDDELNTLNVTLDIAGGELADAFVAVGVPGTSIDDEDYFADFLRSACEVELGQLDETVVEGTFSCPGLTNGAGTKTVDVTGSFVAVP